MLKYKMFRDIKNNLSQFITIFLMVMIGVMTYTGIEAYMLGMTNTANKFYTENNLFDLQVIGNNFTNDDLNKIKSINGVSDAERKLSVNATTNDDKVLLLNIIESNNISKFYVKEGVPFDINKKGVWLDEFYALENNIKLGDIITIKYDTLELTEEVVALINVPDHLYDTKDEKELYPNRKDFGFAYLSVNEIPKDYIYFNYVMVTLSSNDKNAVKNEIEVRLDNALTVIDVVDTKSYATYQGEIDEGKTYVGVFSGLFIFIAMLSVITTMTRVVKNQRIQIGTLKALGFSNKKILFHYIEYGLFISVLGVIMGLLLGYFGIGNFFISLETSFFEIPNGRPYMAKSSYLVALLVVLCVLFIIYITGKSILSENPAETLKNKIPSVKKNSLNLTRKEIFNKLDFSTKWNIRDILRNKARTIMGITGVTGCAMLIVCALGMLNSMNHFIKLQFEILYNFDYKLVLNDNIEKETLYNLIEEYGNYTSQILGIEIKNGNDKKTNNAVVTCAFDRLRFVNQKEEFVSIDLNDGVYVTYKLAQLNNYKLGDTLIWHIYGNDKYYESKIIGFYKDPQNQNITMTKEYLESLGITYKPDSLYTNNDLSNIKEIKGVSIIQDIDSLKESMSNMLSMMKSMISLIILIAVLLGAIIIYNLGTLSYSEKQYQFATLKVLGFDNKKIRKIFIKQNNWIAIISIIIGLPLGYILADFLFKKAIAENYDFSAYIKPLTYLLAGIGTFMVSYLVSLFLSRKKIDMISSLKGNE